MADGGSVTCGGGTLSRTLTHHAFAGVTQDGINQFLKAFFSARPRYLHYGSPPFVSATSATATVLPSLSAPPLISPGIPYEVVIALPRLDLFPPDGALPPPLSLTAHHFAIQTSLKIAVLCGVGRDKAGTPLVLDLDVAAVGHLIVSPGAIGFAVDGVQVGPIQPKALSDILDCILLEVVQGMLSGLSIPIPALSAGMLTLTLEQGPEIDTDEVDAWGNL
jgi:hypothetical protein